MVTDNFETHNTALFTEEIKTKLALKQLQLTVSQSVDKKLYKIYITVLLLQHDFIKF